MVRFNQVEEDKKDEAKNNELREQAEKINEIVDMKLKIYSKEIKLRKEMPGIPVITNLIRERYGIGKSTDELIKYADLWVNFQFYPVKEISGHVLIYGPPGTGKSFFVGVVAEKTGAYLIKASAIEMANPVNFELLYQQAKTVRKLSIKKWIERYGGLENAIEFIANKLIEDAKQEGVTLSNGKVLNFLNEHIQKMSDIITLCSPDDENDVGVAIKLKDEFNKRFNCSSGEIFETLVRYFPGIPVIIYIDEIDSVGNRTLNANPVLNSIFSAIDGGSSRRINSGISFVGTTNSLETLDRALTRKGRMDLLYLPYPDMSQRQTISEVMINRFGDALFKFKKDDIIKVFLKIPLLTGADIFGVINDVVKDMRSRIKAVERIIVSKDDVIRRLEKKKGRDIFSYENAIDIKGFEGIMNLIKGKTVKKPPIYILNELVEKLNVEQEKVDQIDQIGKGYLDYNNLNSLHNVCKLLALSYNMGKGVAVRVDSDELSEMLAYEFQYRLLSIGKPVLIINVYADRLLHGIVGTTRRKVDDLFAKLRTMKESVILFKNIDALQTGSFVGEWENAFVKGIKGLTLEGAVIIGQGGIGYFDNAFDNQVFDAVFNYPLETKIIYDILTNKPNDEIIKELMEMDEYKYEGYTLFDDIVNAVESDVSTLSLIEHRDLSENIKLLTQRHRRMINKTVEKRIAEKNGKIKP
ncbi:ATP-binding protein [Candidatus Micrarchaeota archaeon]|nr:ATP-binding protein [Candidatus Micrarchaeota archaeon]